MDIGTLAEFVKSMFAEIAYTETPEQVDWVAEKILCRSNAKLLLNCRADDLAYLSFNGPAPN